MHRQGLVQSLEFLEKVWISLVRFYYDHNETNKQVKVWVKLLQLPVKKRREKKKREKPFAVVSETEIKMLNTDAVPRNTKAFVFQEIHKI